MSKLSFERLSKEQQDVILAAGQKAEEFFDEATRGLDEQLIKVFQENKVEVVTLSEDGLRRLDRGRQGKLLQAVFGMRWRTGRR